MVLENCSTCMNYWTSHGNYMAGYQYLINNQHIPEAHSTKNTRQRPSGSGSGSSTSKLQNQLDKANNKVRDLQKKLDSANSRNKKLETQLNSAKTQLSSLKSDLSAANTKANDLKKKLDECRKAKKSLEDDATQLKTDKVNLQNIINRQNVQMAQKDADVLKYQKEKITADNRIQTELEPYITALINILNANGLTYPPRP